MVANWTWVPTVSLALQLWNRFLGFPDWLTDWLTPRLYLSHLSKILLTKPWVPLGLCCAKLFLQSRHIASTTSLISLEKSFWSLVVTQVSVKRPWRYECRALIHRTIPVWVSYFSQHLLKHNATVYLAARSPGKAKEAIDDLKASTGKEARFLQLDLSDLKSIKESARVFTEWGLALHYLQNLYLMELNIKRNEKELHVLINNASVCLYY